jgi:hypothetical protein
MDAVSARLEPRATIRLEPRIGGDSHPPPPNRKVGGVSLFWLPSTCGAM